SSCPQPTNLVSKPSTLSRSERHTARLAPTECFQVCLTCLRSGPSGSVIMGGTPSVHPISARESRALRRLQWEAPTSPYVFISERGAPLSVAGYQRMVARAGEAAKFGFLVHSHMLRHGCGFKLAADGQDTRAIQAYLGHRSIQSTVRYTALAPDRFKNFWKD